MPTCKKCGSAFPYTMKVAGRQRSLTKRKFCLSCSPFGANNRADLTRIGDGTKICSRCEVEKQDNEFYTRRGRRDLSAWCKQCQSEYSLEQKRQCKREAVAYKGGACQVCGYDRCIDALCFHHLVPGKKDFTIARKKRKLTTQIKRELDKTVIVCNRCHAEIHAGITDVPVV